MLPTDTREIAVRIRGRVAYAKYIGDDRTYEVDFAPIVDEAVRHCPARVEQVTPIALSGGLTGGVAVVCSAPMRTRPIG